MKESTIQNYEELPLFINAEQLSNALGISISSAYELMSEKDFPSMRVGKRMLVPREKFIAWVNQQSGGERLS